MVEALQLELNTSYQTRETMPVKGVDFGQENLRLQQENVRLQQENVRLLQEVNDMKRENASLERRLTRSFYRIHSLRERQQSSASLGQVMTVIGGLVVVKEANVYVHLFESLQNAYVFTFYIFYISGLGLLAIAAS